MIMRFRSWLLVAVCAVGIWSMSAAQELPSEFDTVLQALAAEVGAASLSQDDVTVVEWTSEQFSDASLGCPRAGMMYAQVITSGYRFVVSYSGATYDYRVAADGLNAVLCPDGSDSRPVTSNPEPSRPLPEPILDSFDGVASGTAWVLETENDGLVGGVVAWSPNGNLLVLAAEDGLQTFVNGRMDIILDPILTDAAVTAMVFLNNQVLVTGDANGEVLFWDMLLQDQIGGFTAHDSAIASMALSPDGRIVTVDENGELRIWAMDSE